MKLSKDSGLRICNFGSEIVLNRPAKKNICQSLQTILLCIVGEFVGGGFVTVALGVSDI